MFENISVAAADEPFLGDGAHVEVVARKSAVTWDKEFARNMLERIVALAGG